MKFSCILLSLICVHCSTLVSLSINLDEMAYDEHYDIRRAKAHMAIGDYSQAIAELKVALIKLPQSKKLREVMIEVLSENGQEVEALKLWKESAMIFPELLTEDNILETLAWGILKKEETSTHLIANIFTMIGASLTHDVKSVDILLKGLRSTNSYLRMVAIRLSAHYGDKVLIEEIQKLLIKDSSWYVRLECMKTLSTLHVDSMGSLLREVLSNTRSSAEEKVIAIQAYLELENHLNEEEMLSFLHSKRMGLRLLGCQMMIFLERRDLLHHVAQLLNDPSLEVKMAAMNVFALLGCSGEVKDQVVSTLKNYVETRPSEVAISAAWSLMMLQSQDGQKALEKYLKSEDMQDCRLAAAALALTGEAGMSLANQVLKTHQDSFVKATLAFGMLGFVKQTALPLQVLYQFLISTEEKIMWKQGMNPLFQSISPSEVRHIPDIAHYPSVVDDHTRLELYNALAIMRFKEAQQGLKSYLKTHSVGVTFAASSALLEEGAEDAMELIHELLDDPDPLIQLQAALVLATLGSDPDSTSVLMKIYPKVDREYKIHILEALGHLGKKDTISFLSNLLDDPFHSVRILAASSLIQCLHH